MSRITVLLYRQLLPKKTSQTQFSYILLKYSQFSNVNNLSLYRIKDYLSLFKKNVFNKFSQKLQILKKYKCFGRDRRLKTIIIFYSFQETCSVSIRKNCILYFFRWHLNQVLTFMCLCVVLMAKKGWQNTKTRFLRSKIFQPPSWFLY